MKFEEALQLMRQGKKIKHPSFEENVYLMACYMVFDFLPLSESEHKLLSIVKMKGNRQHINMECNGLTVLESMDITDKHPQLRDIIIRPQIDLLLLISDDWEVVE